MTLRIRKTANLLNFMNSEVLLGFSKHAFCDFENRSFSMKLCAFCDKLMQVYIMPTPLMLFRSLNFLPF